MCLSSVFIIPRKPKQSQLSSRFGFLSSLTTADGLFCISIFPPLVSCKLSVIFCALKQLLQQHLTSNAGVDVKVNIGTTEDVMD